MSGPDSVGSYADALRSVVLEEDAPDGTSFAHLSAAKDRLAIVLESVSGLTDGSTNPAVEEARMRYVQALVQVDRAIGSLAFAQDAILDRYIPGLFLGNGEV